ncbi:MAG: NADH-quinone oxidoreductase subunit C [Candidatus Poseidoniaceae archaeon]|jgi:NADH:ubiquinone oxidoreductase subunit C|nr:NADH-quinone oxidoreductase subunit C [Candidatus Poseidoniaceae archaeon]
MGMTISKEQNTTAVSAVVKSLSDRFGDAGITAEAIAHKSGKCFDFVRIICLPDQWRAVAKWLHSEANVNHCSMITGTHFPEGTTERGWEVAIHLHRWPIVNVEPHTMTVHDASKLSGNDVPLEIEVFVPIQSGDSPSIPSVQDLWVGADWNEKETWDLVGIDFDGHINMHRVLNPHDSPIGFHPLQRQHKIRYHDFNEMYDDPQGFGRKPVDEGRVK